MSFQAYLDNIRAKTGKDAEALAAEAKTQGLQRPTDVVAWLKAEYGLGHGHAMAVVAVMRSAGQPARSADDRVADYFKGVRAGWRPVFDTLIREAAGFGPGVEAAPAASYISLVKDGRKFAIVQASGGRLDVGVKLKGREPSGRLEAAGAWNAMVTHRVRLGSPSELDGELLGWLRSAWEQA
jgi:hypothetical protein